MKDKENPHYSWKEVYQKYGCDTKYDE